MYCLAKMSGPSAIAKESEDRRRRGRIAPADLRADRRPLRTITAVVGR
jgi:hypothetical protein